MKIEGVLLDEISQLAAIKLDQNEKEELLINLNSLMEDFSCLHDFAVQDKSKTSFPISLRADIAVSNQYLDYLHQNFPHIQNHLLVAPLINHEEK
jgi:Asp-tRNA(Asn)/Glu-tRNA(Gln) amidotransferase C subunit